MSETKRIISININKKSITFYEENGNSFHHKQKELPESMSINDIITSINEKGFVEINFDKDDYLDALAEYAETNEEGILVFKVEKSKLEELIANSGKTKEEAVSILKSDDVVSEAETIVMKDKDGNIIANLEYIKKYFTHALQRNSIKSINNFIKRILKVSKDKNYSIEELFKFLSDGDLPLTEDGSILIYKTLKIASKGKYKDGHSGRVIQSIGTKVSVNPALVSLSNRDECGTGLHVARRSYLSWFNHDVCVLAILRPEDVITVPERDPNKIRVLAYHIIAELSKEQFSKVKQDKSITYDDVGKNLLYNCIYGNHVGILERVVINGPMGTNIVTTKVKQPNTKSKPKSKAKSKGSVSSLKTVKDKNLTKNKVSAKYASKLLKLTNQEKLVYLVDEFRKGKFSRKIIANDLMSIKRKAKVSWKSFGVDNALKLEILDVFNN